MRPSRSRRGKSILSRNLDARTKYFYIATVDMPAVVVKMVGVDSQYAFVTADKAGNPFDGAKNCGSTSRRTSKGRTSGGRPLRAAAAVRAPDEPADPQQEQQA